MDQCFSCNVVELSLMEIQFSLGGVGFSVAAVQLVPYVSFAHELHLQLQNIKECPRN